MDILVQLPVQEWPILQDKLKNLWPLNVPGYFTLHVNLKYPEIRDAFQFKVYCPYGNMENGFVGINTKEEEHGTHDVIFFSISEDTSKIEEAILNTKLIDWSRVMCIDLVTSLTLEAYERVKSKIPCRGLEVGRAKMYHLPGNTKPFVDLRLPDNTYLTSVKPEDIKQVDDTWPYKHSSSHAYFTTLASVGLSYGLYSADTNQLLAWIFINEYNFLCHLHCKEQYRRRGYGEYVTSFAVNELIKEGVDAYAYVVDGNAKPLAIFKKLGFQAVDDAAFIFADEQKTPS